MKILGLNGNHSLLRRLRLRGIEYSTRYDDQRFIDRPVEMKLLALARNLNSEITIAAPYPLTLEDLIEQYHRDGELAKYRGDYAFYIRYCDAVRYATIIVHNFYDILQPVVGVQTNE